MRTPGNDEELAIGFLFTEGIIKYSEQVSDVKKMLFYENKVLITLNENEIPELQNSGRNFYITSGCGVCGKASIDAIRTISVYRNFENSADEIFFDANLLYGMNNAFKKQQVIFESTGGLHASALFELNGNLILLREDVGRHNALDKLIGAAFLNEMLPLNDKVLLLSGRVSFELIQKAAMAGIRIVAAVGAPSSLAVQLAKESGITLIGFLRDVRFNIYSDEKRVKL